MVQLQQDWVGLPAGARVPGEVRPEERVVLVAPGSAGAGHCAARCTETLGAAASQVAPGQEVPDEEAQGAGREEHEDQVLQGPIIR